jgi:hypothetical protein
MANISELVGKIVTEVNQDNNRSIEFICSDGTKYIMTHVQDCCEQVYVEDINGDLSDLISQPGLRAKPITMAEEVSNEKFEKDWLEERRKEDEYFGAYESWTWTFYKLATLNGYVTIRWYGESNGYYSERVDVIKADENGEYDYYDY